LIYDKVLKPRITRNNRVSIFKSDLFRFMHTVRAHGSNGERPKTSRYPYSGPFHIASNRMHGFFFMTARTKQLHHTPNSRTPLVFVPVCFRSISGWLSGLLWGSRAAFDRSVTYRRRRTRNKRRFCGRYDRNLVDSPIEVS